MAASLEVRPLAHEWHTCLQILHALLKCGSFFAKPAGASFMLMGLAKLVVEGGGDMRERVRHVFSNVTNGVVLRS